MTLPSEKARFALWVATVVAVTVALLLLFGGFANAADMGYCKVYANRMSAMALQRLVGVPFIDVSTGRFLYRKMYSACLNSDEMPEIILSEEQQPLIDGMPTPPMRPEPVPGSVPATDATDIPAAIPVAPKAKAKVTKASTDQPLCTRHGKKTLYNGRKWRCI